jgi:hypothetical protein
VGLLASEAGFFWFNYWWGRASYLAANSAPKLRNAEGGGIERHYYMGWLGLKVRGANAIGYQFLTFAILAPKHIIAE